MSWLCKVAGHSFEARYDYQPVKMNWRIRDADQEEVATVMKAISPSGYRCDVCTRCGMVVNRQEGKE